LGSAEGKSFSVLVGTCTSSRRKRRRRGKSSIHKLMTKSRYETSSSTYKKIPSSGGVFSELGANYLSREGVIRKL